MYEFQKMDNKERIIQHACELFLARGIRSVTMDSIATELSISKRTIYEIFKDKDELVIESIKHMITQNNMVLLHIIANAENTVTALMDIIRHQKEHSKSFTPVFVEDFKKYFPAIQSTLYSCKSDLEKFSASYSLLEKGLKEGIFRNELAIELVDNFLHELISLMHTSQRLTALNVTEEEILTNIFIPYFRGLCTPKGLELMDKAFNV